MTQTEKLLESIIEGVAEKKGDRILTMKFDKTGSSICDYFVICEADSSRQTDAIADSVEEFARKLSGEKALHTEGRENAEWILVDFGDIVVHIFQRPFRKIYNLEGLWADAKIEQIQTQISNQFEITN
jgi:ribosome-associated protein